MTDRLQDDDDDDFLDDEDSEFMDDEDEEDDNGSSSSADLKVTQFKQCEARRKIEERQEEQRLRRELEDFDDDDDDDDDELRFYPGFPTPQPVRYLSKFEVLLADWSFPAPPALRRHIISGQRKMNAGCIDYDFNSLPPLGQNTLATQPVGILKELNKPETCLIKPLR